MVDAAAGWPNWPIPTATLDVSVDTPIYAKAKSGGAAQTITLQGFALRVA